MIDGLTPSMLEAADTPALRFLLDHGSYRRAVSTFPSLTPVCLAVDRDRRAPATCTASRTSSGGTASEQRLVEYGSSFGALLASGSRRGSATASST